MAHNPENESYSSKDFHNSLLQEIFPLTHKRKKKPSTHSINPTIRVRTGKQTENHLFETALIFIFALAAIQIILSALFLLANTFSKSLLPDTISSNYFSILKDFPIAIFIAPFSSTSFNDCIALSGIVIPFLTLWYAIRKISLNNTKKTRKATKNAKEKFTHEALKGLKRIEYAQENYRNTATAFTLTRSEVNATKLSTNLNNYEEKFKRLSPTLLVLLISISTVSSLILIHCILDSNIVFSEKYILTILVFIYFLLFHLLYADWSSITKKNTDTAGNYLTKDAFRYFLAMYQSHEEKQYRRSSIYWHIFWQNMWWKILLGILILTAILICIIYSARSEKPYEYFYIFIYWIAICMFLFCIFICTFRLFDGEMVLIKRKIEPYAKQKISISTKINTLMAFLIGITGLIFVLLFLSAFFIYIATYSNNQTEESPIECAMILSILFLLISPLLCRVAQFFIARSAYRHCKDYLETQENYWQLKIQN